jgi:hypothetical protein
MGFDRVYHWAMVTKPTVTISARLSAEAPQVEVLTPLALVLGARVGLSIEQIDDLAMAVELLVRHQPTIARDARFSISEGGLEVALSGIDPEWLERRTPMLEVLVSQVIGDPGGVRLLVAS